jgi:ethanolamine ammonia-lyase small subunit
MLNQPDPNKSFWKDEELISHLNDAVRIYFSELVVINEGYSTTQIKAFTETIADFICEKANIKADPRVFASDGEVAAMEELEKKLASVK